MPLKPFQIPLADQAVSSLEARRFFVNACVTGSGKTFVCCDVMNRRRRPVLVVTPKAALTQWERVAESMNASQWLLDIINPEQISKPTGCKWYNRRKLWSIPPDTDVVYDEIHRTASGIDSVSTMALAQLKAYGASLHAMSATVACDPMHLRVLGYWAGLHSFAKGDFCNWCRLNGCHDVQFGGSGRRHLMFAKNPIAAARYMADIRRSFGTTMLALGPDDIPGFPTQTLQIKLVDLSSRDRLEIDEAYSSMSERMKARGKTEMAELTKERQRIEFVMAEALAEMTADSVEDGYSVFTCLNFTEPRERCLAALAKRGITKVSQVYGTGTDGRSQTDSARQEGIDLFQRNVNPVMLANAAAGGVALSLHDVHHERMRVSYILPSYNAAEIRQALGRLRRVDGTHSVQNICVAAGTVMERVSVSLDRKLDNLDSLLDPLTDADLIP